jgi:hypothetical protein
MIDVGDKVKVIPRSYVGRAKSDLNQRHAWEVSNEEGTHIMLGGIYKVLAIEQSPSAFAQGANVNFYKLIPGNTGSETISELNVLPVHEVELCQFKVGDAVVFRPKCTPQDLEYLKALDDYYGLSDLDKEHKVTDILNDYYIFVDVPKNDPYSFPFRWIDFELKG